MPGASQDAIAVENSVISPPKSSREQRGRDDSAPRPCFN
jgi:hypothetical protein